MTDLAHVRVSGWLRRRCWKRTLALAVAAIALLAAGAYGIDIPSRHR